MVDVIENISVTINNLKATNAKVKIGVTGKNPVDCFNEQLEKNDWDRMVIIYDTHSKKFISDLMERLVNVSWFCQDNQTRHADVYTLYALVKD